jgi:hypothetical protein
MAQSLVELSTYHYISKENDMTHELLVALARIQSIKYMLATRQSGLQTI